MTVTANRQGGIPITSRFTATPMIAPHVNLTPPGTYVDVAGATYVEVPGQVRVTLSTLRRRSAGVAWSVHVSANTGNIQFYDVTKAADIFNVNFTSLTEVTVGTAIQALITATNTTPGDVLTVRTKNSNAGESVTVDSGGILEGDLVNNGSGTAFLSGTLTGLILQSAPGGVIQKVQIAILKVATDVTFNIRLLQAQGQQGQFSYTGVPGGTVGFVPDLSVQIGQTITEAANGTVVTRIPKFRPLVSGLTLEWVSVLGAIAGGGPGWAVSFEIGLVTP